MKIYLILITLLSMVSGSPASRLTQKLCYTAFLLEFKQHSRLMVIQSKIPKINSHQEKEKT